jgi:hypothetical protein
VVTATAPAALPSPMSIQRIRIKGSMLGGVVGAMIFLNWIGLFKEASGWKSVVSADLFLPNLENLVVGKV